MENKLEILKVELNENQEPIVGGRELHEVLGVKTQYTKWFERMCEYGFLGLLVSQKCLTNNPKNPYTEVINHAIKLDMAKEIAMIQRNEKGKQVRQYFIQVERDFNSPDKIMARALKMADIKINQLSINMEKLQLENSQKEQVINELKPKADYTDKILQSKNLVTITAIAKDYGMGAKTMNKKLHELGVQYNLSGQWLLYAKYQDKGYTHSETIDLNHKDGSEFVKMNTKWTQKGRLFLYELLKDNGLLPMIERI